MKPKSWQHRPDNGRLNLFLIWAEWLSGLGGTFEAAHDPSERKLTGRRDPDRKPRQYDLSNDEYGKDPNTGTIWRRPVKP